MERQRGAGRDPVIIVPGITSPAVTWGFVGERFGASFDTYILDVRGRGLSEAGDQAEYDMLGELMLKSIEVAEFRARLLADA